MFPRCVAWNDILAPATTSSFGFCADRASTPSNPTATSTATQAPSTATATRPPATATASATTTRAAATVTPTAAATADAGVQIAIVDDWGTGYCANVVVSATAPTAVDWQVSFVIDGQLRELWNAAYSVVGGRLTAEGLSWNNLVTRDQPVTFGFCALR